MCASASICLFSCLGLACAARPPLRHMSCQIHQTCCATHQDYFSRTQTSTGAQIDCLGTSTPKSLLRNCSWNQPPCPRSRPRLEAVAAQITQAIARSCSMRSRSSDSLSGPFSTAAPFSRGYPQTQNTQAVSSCYFSLSLSFCSSVLWAREL